MWKSVCLCVCVCVCRCVCVVIARRGSQRMGSVMGITHPWVWGGREGKRQRDYGVCNIWRQAVHCLCWRLLQLFCALLSRGREGVWRGEVVGWRRDRWSDGGKVRINGWAKGVRVRGENSCWNAPRYWLTGRCTAGRRECVRRVWSNDGGIFEKKKMYECGRNGVGFADMQMTSAAEGRWVKDTPASRSPPECVHVVVCISLDSPLPVWQSV